MRGFGVFLIIFGIILAVASNALKDMNQGVAVYDGDYAEDLLEKIENGENINDLKPSGYMGRNQEGIEVAEVLTVVGIVTVIFGGIVFAIGCFKKARKSEKYDY